jgi:PPK2 family polyphosphate:nucleotide phosphotransferase
MSDRIADVLRADVVDGSFTLAGWLPDATPLIDSKGSAKEELVELGERLFDLHEMMFAGKDRSVLLVLQGSDASGKNGTIKHVLRHVNPAGLRVASFEEPTEEERRHHFLWRIREEVPGPGMIGVFNRSHYEDVLVPLAEGSDDDLDSRFDDIRAFEEELHESGIIVVKCLLHISYDEQRQRFLRRLRREDKRWKFAESDLETRRLWDEYQLAYGEVVARSNWEHAPWYVVPADHKWYRNWAVARLLVDTLEGLNLAYPQPDLDLETLRERLEAA